RLWIVDLKCRARKIVAMRAALEIDRKLREAFYCAGSRYIVLRSLGSYVSRTRTENVWCALLRLNGYRGRQQTAVRDQPGSPGELGVGAELLVQVLLIDGLPVPELRRSGSVAHQPCPERPPGPLTVSLVFHLGGGPEFSIEDRLVELAAVEGGG